MHILGKHKAPHDFPVEKGHSVSPCKVWRDLILKTFQGRGGASFGGQIYWGTVLHGGLMIISNQGQECFTNAFSRNLRTVYPKIFASH